jgi:hypothetical protein
MEAEIDFGDEFPDGITIIPPSEPQASMQLSGTLRARPEPGTVGRTYYITDIGITLTDDGTEWVIPTAGGHKSSCLYNEFDSQPPDTGARSWWYGVEAGTGQILGNEDSGETYWAFRTGTTSGGASRFSSIAEGNSGFDPTNLFLMVLKMVSGDPAVSGQDLHGGLSDPPDQNFPDDAVYLRKDNAGNWFAIIRSGSTNRLSVDLGSTSTAHVIFEYDGTDLKIYKGTFNAAGLAAGGTLSANLPTAQLNMSFRISSSNNSQHEGQAHLALLHMARP